MRRSFLHIAAWLGVCGPVACGQDRIALLPPIDFNLEQDAFANEPLSDADPELVAPRALTKTPSRKNSGAPFGSSAPFTIGGFWAPPVAVAGQPAQLGMNAEHVRVSAPLGIPAEGAPIWIGIARFGRLELATNAVLPDSGTRVPDQLWLVETGVMHIRPLESGGTLGGTFLFGSASDRPYAAGRDLTLMTIGFYNRPARHEGDDWSFSIFYSPTSQLPYPLPGIAYIWRPDETLEAKLGLPAAIEWRPTEDWIISANYFPLVNFNATARRRLGDGLFLLASYRTDTEIYFLADRIRDDERFYVFDQRVAMGLERVLGRGFSLEFMGSYLFGRQLFQGTSFSSGRIDVVNVDPGFGLSLQMLWRR